MINFARTVLLLIFNHDNYAHVSLTLQQLYEANERWMNYAQAE